MGHWIQNILSRIRTDRPAHNGNEVHSLIVTSECIFVILSVSEGSLSPSQIAPFHLA
jgi:hypothetical protein